MGCKGTQTATTRPEHALAQVPIGWNRVRVRFLEFFAANIRNPHTRRGYSRAVGEFLAWCADAGVPSIAHLAPLQRPLWSIRSRASARRSA
jgi:hypothetical protein